ncbi:MAG: Uma2 family endonuclease [Deltaproteobacteria bacterium]
MFEVEARGNVVVMHDVSWETYLAIDAERCYKKWPRLTYLDRELEIVSPTGQLHELRKTVIRRLLEAYAAVMGRRFNGYGNMTIQNQKRRVGLAPDECYFVDTIDLDKHPDIAIEVVVTSGGLHKLAAYHRLGVREVWFWIDDALQIYELRGRSYALVPKSRFFPDLDLIDLATRVRSRATHRDQTAAVEAYRAWLQR